MQSENIGSQFGHLFLPHTNAAGLHITPPLFMTGDEIMSHYRVGDYAGKRMSFEQQKQPYGATEQNPEGTAGGKTVGEMMWDEKAKQAEGPSNDRNWGNTVGSQSRGVADSIREHGYEWGQGYPSRTQVLVDPAHPLGPSVLGGHHRVAAMQKYRPDEFIPTYVHTNQNSRLAE